MVIQYTILQYIMGQITWAREGSGRKKEGKKERKKERDFCLMLIKASESFCSGTAIVYLEWYVSHCFRQVVGLETVPVVEMFPQKH